MRVTVLGCGGSMGVPMVGGIWGTCDPANPRNRRRRPSILVQSDSTTILIDTSPDLRDQLLDHDVKRVDALLYTHAHADHIHGIDDLRPLAFKQPINAYMDSAVRQELEERFGYTMTSVEMDRGFYHPFLVPHLLDGPFRVGDIDILPFEQDHGRSVSMGYRFGRFAYSTDVVRLDDRAWAALEGVDLWMVDATRPEPHVSHAHLALTVEWIERLKPKQAWLTHMNHQMDYDWLCRQLPGHVRPAHDGLVIEIG
ncbi:MBL fold metallo-hydrolase [Inquilinus sp. CA228]|uniref:MBL fold metallo-hydrolase n=1 Tax=Inquilinus sp. CA228 TaxID=3455609 RepID=UPI003F8D14E4